MPRKLNVMVRTASAKPSATAFARDANNWTDTERDRGVAVEAAMQCSYFVHKL
jgi:hypothetical protein